MTSIDTDGVGLVAERFPNEVQSGAAAEIRFSPDLFTLSKPSGAAAESVRVLRTYVMAQHIQEGRRALAICAPSAEVGCTLVAANLAVALSQVGVKTLLIDGDLRRPSLERFFTPSRPVAGLAQSLSLSGEAAVEGLQDEVLPNLSLLFAGGAAANAQELLAGEKFKDLMELCLRDFDATIIDTPPSNTCADSRRISTVAGYSLIVARRNFSLVHDVKTLSAQLQGDHAKVVGTVLNEG